MAFHQASSSSSSSSASSSRWDVFLSFRGKDTRKNFTAHLCTTMRQKGIHTFMDDKLKSGEEISPELVKAIEGSKISIIVLSKNYASSRWCLDELMKILDCRTRGQQVLPLFYDVTPLEVRHTTHTVGDAFVKLEKRYKDDEKKVNEWKTALKKVADLSGKHLENYRNEPEFISEIIEWVNSILVKKTHFQVAKYPIRIESRVEDLKSLLDIEKNDGVCMVGIFGTGGIGKTTIAKAVYNSIAAQFKGSCFLGNIRETSRQIGDMIRLQKELLSKILEDSSLMVNHVDEGITLIKERLHNLRVLLVLDDVDQLDQLEKLAGKDDWFGLGSRIIITTRDTHVLTAHGIHLTYQVKELEDNEALQLFSWHAFKRDKPNDDFVELTKHAISYAGGLPLALVVLGSDLFGKGLREWKSALDRYKRIPNKDIQKILKISYDGLAETIQDIFLDIACFFKGEELGYVSKILDSCGFFPDDGIKVLVNKSLISIDHEEYFDKRWPHKKSYKTLEMHDLVQEMGREIVRQESPKEPGKRSRLWFHEDVCHVLEGDTETIKVEGILIDLPKQDLRHLNSEAFKKMKWLRLLIKRNACFSEEPTFLSNELRLIDWAKYPGEFFPSNFHGKNLVVLRMPKSHIKGLEGLQKFQNLTTMNFSSYKFLEKIPDVSMILNLESLVLDFCKNLVEVHHSVGFLDKLVLLSATGCCNLSSFPTSLELRSLESLLVSECLNLKNFPKIKCQMKCLELIDFSWTGIKELPSSIKYLVGIKKLDLGCCRNLMHLPDNIDQLQHLEILNLHYCKQLRDILRLPPNVVEVQASWCESLQIFLEEGRISQLLNTWDPPEPMGVRTASPALQLSNLGNNVLKESEFSIQHNCPSSLKVLDLSYSAIVSLPTCFNRFVGLKILKLEFCEQLQDILILPPNVVKVQAKWCTSLRIFLEEGRRSQLLNTWDPPEPVGVRTASLALQLSNLGNNVLKESEFSIQHNCPSSLKVLDLSYSAIVSLPTCFNRFVGLEILKLNNCEQLRDILRLPPNLVKVEAWGCVSLAIFLEEPRRAASPALQSDFLIQRNCPSSLKVLDLSYSAIVSLPTCFNRFVGLEILKLNNCEQLRDILRLPPNVVKVDASRCTSLRIFLEEGRRSQLLNTWDPPEPVGVRTASLALQLSNLGNNVLKESEFSIHHNCSSSLKVLDLSYSAIVSLPTCFNRFVGLEILKLNNCEQLRDILRLPPNVVEVDASRCTSLRIFLEEGRRSQLLNTWDPPEPVGVRTASLALQLSNLGHNVLKESEFSIQHNCSSSLKVLDLSYSAIVSLPTCFNRFVGLEILKLNNCEQLRDILRLPPNVVEVDASRCTSLRIFLEEGRRSQLLNTWDPPEPVGIRTASPALQLSNLGNNVLKESEFSIQHNCPSSLKVLDLSYSAIVSLPTCFNRFVGLEILKLNNCEQLRDILRLPPNVVKVEAWGCVSLAIFLEEPRRVASPALQSDFLIQRNCPSSLKVLDLSYSAIVSLPTCFNRFVGLMELYLDDCGQLEEIPELPPNIKEVYLKRCTSLERFQFNNINDLPMLEWIDFSDCHGLLENMGDDLQIRFLSEGHAEHHEFSCLFPGNKIPDCFNHRKEVSNAESCEIDINEPLHLDSENTRFVFSAVIRGESSKDFRIIVKVINNGQCIDIHKSRDISNLGDSDNVYLHYSGSHHFQLKMDNLRVLFTLHSEGVYFKSCGFHLEHRYEEKAICIMDGVQLPMKRRRDDDGDGDDSNWESN